MDVNPNKIVARGSVTLAWASRRDSAEVTALVRPVTRRRLRVERRAGRWMRWTGPRLAPDLGIRVAWRGGASLARLPEEAWDAVVGGAATKSYPGGVQRPINASVYEATYRPERYRL